MSDRAMAIVALCLLLSFGYAAPTSAATSQDETAFTVRRTGAFVAEPPQARVSIIAPLRLKIAGPAPADEEFAPLDPSTLRAVVRSRGYVEVLRRKAAAALKGAPVVRLVAGDVWLVCVADHPGYIKLITDADLAAIGLSEEAAIALAEHNLVAALPNVSKTIVPPPAPVEFGAIRHENDDEYYQSSWFILHDQWAELARQIKGSLVVAIPTVDLVLFGDTANPQAVPGMAAYAAKIVAAAQRPISATVFKWTREGWEPVSPTKAPDL